MDLGQKVCLVTGGTRGIGAATAMALAREGASVAIMGRFGGDAAKATKARIEALNRRCELILGDCAKASECIRCVEEATEKLGSVDVLVHAAGGPIEGGLFEVTPQDWLNAFDVHVNAIFYFCRAAIPAMQKKKEGAVVLISSVAGLRGLRTSIAYQTVKGALPQFARALARELAEDNIRVNCVAPGIIRTRFHDQMSEAQRKFNVECRIPLHCEGSAEQVADVVVTLVKNDYITGETITIDGGLTMRLA